MEVVVEAVPTLDTGDSAWMMMSTVLVLLMTPAGLALFYAVIFGALATGLSALKDNDLLWDSLWFKLNLL